MKLGDVTISVIGYDGRIRERATAPVYDKPYGCEVAFPESLVLADGESYTITPALDSFLSDRPSRIPKNATLH